MRCKSLSSSKIKTYSMCEYKYCIEYHLGLSTGKSFAAEQGSLIHYILEKFALAIRDGKDNEGKTLTWLKKNWKTLLFDGYIDRFGNKNDGYHGDNPIWGLSKNSVDREKQCKTCPFSVKNNCRIANKNTEEFEGCPRDEYEDAIWLIEKVINDKSPNNPLNKKIIDVENKFALIIKDGENKIQTNGIIDIVTEIDDDTIEICDYKTGKYIQSYKDCEKDPQLLIYHLAAKELYDKYKHVFVTVYYIRRKSGPTTLAFEKEDDNNTKNIIKYYWNQIKSNKNPKRRCDKPDGTIRPDYVCKKMCDWELCKKIHKKFMELGGTTSE